ncbi:hypothetical protein, partial [Rhodanobacter sp. A1T4]|uniref:hypothetical protein n=1 Tax=Rhodanobacter sp. A1T4 TaxID=2723087 RepID=UPI001C87F131
QAEHSELQAEHSELQAEHSELQAEHSELQAEHSELQAEHNVLSERASKSAHALTTANDEIERLRMLVNTQTWRLSVSDQAKAHAESELALIRRSRSWRLTYPLRAAKPLIRAVCARTARVLVRLPGIRPLTRLLLNHRPSFKQRLVILMYGLPSTHEASASNATNQAPLAGSSADSDATSHEFASPSRSASEAFESLKRYRKSKEKAR